MSFKPLKPQMHRGMRLILVAFSFLLAMVMVSFTRRMAYETRTNESNLVNLDKCSLDVGLVSQEQARVFVHCRNLTISVVKELMNKDMLSLEARSLCVGDGSDSDLLTLRELGFYDASRVCKNPISSMLGKRIEHGIDFGVNSFDFVLSMTFGRVPVPPLLVIEIERVLRPGGIGVMLVGFSNFRTGGLVRSATPVLLLLRSSEILHVCGIGSFALIVFKKRLNHVSHFEDYRLPSECPSVSRNKPFMQRIEPLIGFEKDVSFLPEFVAELEPSYPIHPQAFDVFVVDHNMSALSSYVKKPGVTFVYHPGLIEDEVLAPGLNRGDYLEAPLHGEEFEFIKWFKKTTKDGDFVVLMMNADVTQLKVMSELFESGAICHVDEVFIRCSEGVDCGNSRCNDCPSLFNGLRNAGVFVHRWSGV